MQIRNRAIALIAGVGLAAAGAAADDTVVVGPPLDAPTVAAAAVVATQPTPALPAGDQIASARLDPALLETTAADDTLSLSPSVMTGVVFLVISVTLFITQTDGDAKGPGN